MRKETCGESSRQHVDDGGSDDRKRKRGVNSDGEGKARVDDQQPVDLDYRSDTENLLILPKMRHRWEHDTPNNTNLNQAQSTTLGLSQTIMKTLPRKLREQIYAHILAIGNVKITVCDGKLPYHIRSRCDRMRTHDSFWDATDLKHYVDPLCVGTQMADEIAQSYYKTNTFYFDYHELYLLEKFLTIDRFGRGLRPAHLVQSIEIVLDEQYLCPCNGNALFFHGLAATNAIAPEAVIRSCLSQLLSLTTESAKISFIVYSLDRRNRYLDPKHKLVEILSSIMSKLISQGHSTSLALYNGAGCQWSIKGSAVRPIEEVLTESMARIY